jgi:hypothetical protein
MERPPSRGNIPPQCENSPGNVSFAPRIARHRWCRPRYGRCSSDWQRRTFAAEDVMARWRLLTVIVVFGFAGSFAPGRVQAQGIESQRSLQANALRRYTTQLEDYALMRAGLEGPLTPFDSSRHTAWSLHLQRLYLASAIRHARRGQMLGTILTPVVADALRRRISAAASAVDEEGSVADLAVEGVKLAINEPVPEWAMRALPAALIAQLPALPEAIEYRLVGDTLILWDVHAEILIDALSGALGWCS